MTRAATRHGRPHAGRIDRPRGYPTTRVPDIARTTAHKPTASAWIPGKLSLVLCWLGVIFLVLPGYM